MLMIMMLMPMVRILSPISAYGVDPDEDDIDVATTNDDAYVEAGDNADVIVAAAAFDDDENFAVVDVASIIAVPQADVDVNTANVVAATADKNIMMMMLLLPLMMMVMMMIVVMMPC